MKTVDWLVVLLASLLAGRTFDREAALDGIALADLFLFLQKKQISGVCGCSPRERED